MQRKGITSRKSVFCSISSFGWFIYLSIAFSMATGPVMCEMYGS